MDDASIWLILGPILAALYGAVVGGFIREWWVERFYRPKLQNWVRALSKNFIIE